MVHSRLTLARGATIGGWQVQRVLGDQPWPEAKAQRADGVAARVRVVPAASPPDETTLARWRAAAAPAWLDHEAFPPLRGLGHDVGAGAVWLARAWTPWRSLAAVLAGEVVLPPGRRGALACAVGEALARLHAGGAAHGALAPAGVLVARADGTACELLDLGLAAIAADLGRPVPGALVPDGGVGQPADVAAFAALVEALLVDGAPADAPWRDPLAGWCAELRRGPAATRPSIDDALRALRPLLPAPEPPEPPPPPPPPPSAEELARIEAAASQRKAEADARVAALRRQLDPPRHGPPQVDRDTPFVPPIVVGGPAVAADVWPALVRARRPHAAVHLDGGALVTGPIRWLLGGGQTVAAADAIADGVAEAVDVLDGERRWLGGRGLAAALEARGFTPVVAWPGAHARWGRVESPPSGQRWWHRLGARAIDDGRVVALQREYQGWVTSHETGTLAQTVVEVRTSELPRGLDRDRLLAAILAVLARADERPSITYVCRFCRREFGGLRFHADLGACHGCSEHHLHIVH